MDGILTLEQFQSVKSSLRSFAYCIHDDHVHFWSFRPNDKHLYDEWSDYVSQNGKYKIVQVRPLVLGDENNKKED